MQLPLLPFARTTAKMQIYITEFLSAFQLTMISSATWRSFQLSLPGTSLASEIGETCMAFFGAG